MEVFLIFPGDIDVYMYLSVAFSLLVRILLQCIHMAETMSLCLLGDEYCVRPNVIKFKKLMTSKNVPVLRKLCHFIKIIFSIACPP